MGTKARAVSAVIRRAVRSGRGVLGASVVSVFAGWVVRAIGVVTVLALAVESIVAGVVGLVAFALYVGVGYDRFYDALVRRVQPGPASDFAARTVIYPLGALAVAGAFAALGAVDPTGTFPALGPSNDPAMAVLFEGLTTLPVGLLLAATGGLLVVEAGGSLLRRVGLSRADAYVGMSDPGGTVALTGTVAENAGDPADSSERGRRRLEVSFEDYGAGSDDDDATDDRTDPVSRVAAIERSDDDLFATDGGQPAAVADGAGDADEPELLALAAYDEDEPVLEDSDAGRVVATRADCHPDEWIETVVTYLVEEFYAEHGVDLSDDQETLHRFRIVAKRVREDLEDRTETEVLLPFVAEVPGDGGVHLRKTLTVVPPSGAGTLRPPFSTVGPVPSTDPAEDAGDEGDGGHASEGDGGASLDDDGDVASATFEPVDGGGRPVDDPADESLVEATRPPERLAAPGSGSDCVGYVHLRREHGTRGVEVAGRTVPVTGRRLASFESDLVAFDVQTFGSTIRVDPGTAELALDPDPVETDDPDAAYEATIEPGDTVTVVGRMEPSDDPAYDYEIRRGPSGEVVVTDRTPDELSAALTRGTALRLAVGVPLLAAGLSLTPLVGVGPGLASAAVGSVVGLGVGLAVAVAVAQYLPPFLTAPFANAAGTVEDWIR